MSAVQCFLVVLFVGIVRGQGSNDFVTDIVNECFTGKTYATNCMRHKVLDYFNNALGIEEQSTGRFLGTSDADQQIIARVSRYLYQNEFQVTLPAYFLDGATITFRPSRGLAGIQITLPEDDSEEGRSTDEARKIKKKKLKKILLPILLLIKLKLKILLPIIILLLGIKAIKAFIISKIALLLVGGMFIMQLCKKLGMPMPMQTVTEPPAAYGPATQSSYGAPMNDNSYAGGWDSGAGQGGGPYARWDPHSMAYSAYAHDVKPISLKQSS